jgi:trk system potassium uptake protein TrkA
VKALVIGCGRVGSAVAQQLQQSGWDVTVLDENEDALGRLGESWTGGFVVGHGMDLQLLREAGIEEADAVVVTTDGDNSNLVIAQAAQKHFEVPTVVVRVLDPARAQFYAARGLRVICPTSAAIETLVAAVRQAEEAPV